MKKQAGFTLLELLLAISILGVAVYGFVVLRSPGAAAIKRAALNTTASGYATELVELFRSMTSAQLIAYLSTNPVIVGNPPYPLCAHIGIMDRNTGNIINGDPITNLPDQTTGLPNIFRGFEGTRAPNRWYLVEVVNSTTLTQVTAPSANICGRSPIGMALGADERLYVTVGMTWFPTAEATINDVQRLTVGTVNPD